jgi:cold shock CspA family protein
LSLPKDPEFDESARLSARPPAEPIGTDHTAIGRVKWWKDAKGFGAIACAEFAPWDIWFHYSTVPKAGIATLPSGEEVEAHSEGDFGVHSVATGERLRDCTFTGTDGQVTIEVGAKVEVDFHRANQESFKYVADRVRLLKS